MTQVTSALGRGGPSQRKRMTLCGESRMNLEAARSNTLLGKRSIRMGTWNVRMMYAMMYATFQVAAETRLGRRHQEIGADLESARKESPGQR